MPPETATIPPLRRPTAQTPEEKSQPVKTPPPTTPASGAEKPKKRLINTEKLGPAFWTIASTLSLIVNVILIIVIVILVRQLFSLKALVNDQLLGGLYNNFVLMDQARIKSTIPVSAEVPAKFTLPLETQTVVVLSQDTYIQGARVSLSTGGLAIEQAPTNIILPAGAQLPVFLKLQVPVDEKIPVNLNVAVDIPLNQTELHQPFVGLQEVVGPYHSMLNDLPNSWNEAVCGPQPNFLCRLLLP